MSIGISARLAIGAVVASAAVPALGDPLPSGSIGFTVGGTSGTGADAKRIGWGLVYGGYATWQPMTTEQRLGWSLKWSALSGTMFSASAARISELGTLQFDMLGGIRIRPGVSSERFLSVRAGPTLFRANQPIPTEMQRVFVGGVGSIGFEQYVSAWLFDVINVDIRYSMVVNGPSAISLVIGIAKIGP
ncbi:MAG: hypothetical protein AB7O24_13815 [Kofleriaceae bacterium]